VIWRPCGGANQARRTLQAVDQVEVLAGGAIRESIKQYGQWPTIPQLYVDGQLIGGSDIVEQMANSGELHTALGLPAPLRRLLSAPVREAIEAG
jgi:glutaredoxin-related protein